MKGIKLDAKESDEMKRALWRIRNHCHRNYLSWATYDVIDLEVTELLKRVYGDEWRI